MGDSPTASVKMQYEPAVRVSAAFSSSTVKTAKLP